MRPSTSVLSKASRFPLKSKHANKDYYKGNRQSHPDGVGYRTGPPGRHGTHNGKHGKANYMIDDRRVRIYIGPGFDSAESSVFQCKDLRPFAYTAVPEGSGVDLGLPGLPANRVRFYEDLAKEFVSPGSSEVVKSSRTE